MLQVPAVATQGVGTKNIAPNPSTLEGWSALGSTHGALTRIHGGEFLKLNGRGAPEALSFSSPIIAVEPGASYTLSAEVDLSAVNAGAAWLWVLSSSGYVIYERATIPAGTIGRYGFTTKIPSGVKAVRLGFYTNGISVDKGTAVTFGAPEFGLR